MKFRSGFIGFVGLPNAGKSCLINAIVGEKVGIVTPKPQTTRQRVVGVYSDHEAQILCVDTPGWVNLDLGINKLLKEEVKAVVRDSDALVAVLHVDAKSFQELQAVVTWVQSHSCSWCIVINKADLAQKHRVALLRESLSHLGVPIVSTSATRWASDLPETLIPVLKDLVPEGDPLYGNDIYTTQTVRQGCSEVIREKCFEFLHQEIPYGMAVRVVDFSVSRNLNISAELIVSKESHRPIVIGRRGQTLKRIGQSARKEMEKIVGKKIFLNLHVKVQPCWMKEKKFLKELGYVVT